jgi:hypothetical protein
VPPSSSARPISTHRDRANSVRKGTLSEHRVRGETMSDLVLVKEGTELEWRPLRALVWLDGCTGYTHDWFLHHVEAHARCRGRRS